MFIFLFITYIVSAIICELGLLLLSKYRKDLPKVNKINKSILMSSILAFLPILNTVAAIGFAYQFFQEIKE